MLEKHYGWSGILSEPARCWHERLKQNRTALVDFRCVWSEGGLELEFLEDEIPELSTLHGFQAENVNKGSHSGQTRYKVPTVTLNDLLLENGAPDNIDYLSIDTEGSEFSILSSFDFAKHRIDIITVEHNFVEENRQAIFDLLTRQGYVRVFEPFSAWDDWYVRADIEKHSRQA